MTAQAETDDPKRLERIAAAERAVSEAEAMVEATRQRTDPVCEAFASTRAKATWNPRLARTEAEQQALLEVHANATSTGRAWLQEHGAALLTLRKAKTDLRNLLRAQPDPSEPVDQ